MGRRRVTVVKVPYGKVPISIDDQILMLKGRGLAFGDEAKAKQLLGNVTYFRLVAYMRPMEADKVTHQFKANATWEKAVELYDFDTELRKLIFAAIQKVEIAVRSKMINRFSLVHGAFWFVNSGLCVNERLFVQNMGAVDRELDRAKDDFIREHFERYSSPAYPPAWKTMELATFGTLSKLFANFSDSALKNDIAKDFGLPRYVMLESWIQCLAVLRNACAHHSRVWNKVFTSPATMPERLPMDWVDVTVVASNRLYARLCCIVYLLNAIDAENGFVAAMKELLVLHPNVDVSAMGFPSGWELEPLWKSASDEVDASDEDVADGESSKAEEVSSTGVASADVASAEDAGGKASEKE